MQRSKAVQKLLDKWELSWDLLDVMIGGQSSIDLSRFPALSWDEATLFLRNYGYDPENPTAARFIHQVIIEAWHFIHTTLMPQEWKKGKRPSDELLLATDARTLIMQATDRSPAKKKEQAWACAVLRVMHTIAHIEGVHRPEDVSMARDQIFSRFRAQVFTDEKGVLRFGRAKDSVALKAIEWKQEKTRDSIILKLLHKKANVAETIYDMLGIRLVTKRQCDVMLMVKMLQKYEVVVFPNCLPTRARNNLLDVGAFRACLDELRIELSDGRITRQDFVKKMGELNLAFAADDANQRNSNPHSGSNYRAIQLTCRQLIKYPNPLLIWFEKVNRLAEDPGISPATRRTLTDVVQLARGWHGISEQPDVLGFFPFEVQILDRRTATKNKSGSAAHERYKRSQIKAARRRVLANVLNNAH